MYQTFISTLTNKLLKVHKDTGYGSAARFFIGGGLLSKEAFSSICKNGFMVEMIRVTGFSEGSLQVTSVVDYFVENGMLLGEAKGLFSLQVVN